MTSKGIIWADRDHPVSAHLDLAQGVVEERLKEAVEIWTPPEGARVVAACLPIYPDGFVRATVRVETADGRRLDAWAFVSPGMVEREEWFQYFRAPFLDSMSRSVSLAGKRTPSTRRS